MKKVDGSNYLKTLKKQGSINFPDNYNKQASKYNIYSPFLYGFVAKHET